MYYHSSSIPSSVTFFHSVSKVSGGLNSCKKYMMMTKVIISTVVAHFSLGLLLLVLLR
jgi:hypothetical protein